ncbi:DNA topoisomerase III [Paraburkholderia tropica]|uniref:DNA topoisomerase III n=1 Tax=Paraburkholderia tropica TaxID=92647 RepID=UPI002AB7A794|nr:DNA topoisomerase III [Paraburkholderia tropica]
MVKLYICEKPSQAKDLAPFVGARERGNGVFTGPGVTVTWCIGHLLEQAKPEYYEPRLASWDINLLPVLPAPWSVIVKDKLKAQFNIVAKQIKLASEVVIATDADREGEVIAREVMDLAGYRGPVRRLWLSALDAASVRKALGRLKEGGETLPLYFSGLGRGRADWLAGMNLTMALTKAFGTGGKTGTLHFGRVQTPVLALIVRRERAIRNFVPKVHYGLKSSFNAGGATITMGWLAAAGILDGDGHVIAKPMAEAAASRVRAQEGVVTRVESTPESEPAPLPCSLGSLQREASARYGLKAQAVLDACQALYETHKATTYPRTDCEYLPVSMFAEVPGVLDALAAIDPDLGELAAIAGRGCTGEPGRAFNDRKMTAHHAIIPTANARVTLSALSKTERLVYDLIRRRYLAQFLGDFQYQKTVVDVDCKGELFRVTGKTPTFKGWRAVLVAASTRDEVPSGAKEDEAAIALPPLAVGAPARNVSCEVEKKQTKAPDRYTEGSLLAAMESIDREIDDERLKKIMRTKEKAGIGTDATRSAIIENLFGRDYIANDPKKKKQIMPLEKGEALIGLLEKVAPQLADPVLTAEWEDRLMQIESGRVRLEQFEAELGGWIRALTSQIRSQAGTQRIGTGADVSAAEASPAHACPVCAKAMRRIKGPRGQFWGCSGYPECRATLPDVEGKPGAARAGAVPRSADARDGAGAGRAGVSVPCPNCGKVLRARTGAKGAFWGCSGYPDCRTTLPDENGKPGVRMETVGGKATPAEIARTIAPAAQTPVARIGEPCPGCGKGTLVTRSERNSGRQFAGCSLFPDCRYFRWL